MFGIGDRLTIPINAQLWADNVILECADLSALFRKAASRAGGGTGRRGKAATSHRTLDRVGDYRDNDITGHKLGSTARLFHWNIHAFHEGRIVRQI